jgi:hypothetical protein
MGFRFRKSFKIAPGFRLNLSNRGMSVRAGGRGFGYTAGTSGQRISAGVPGTGLSYSTKLARTKQTGGFVSMMIGIVVFIFIFYFIVELLR